MAKHTVTNKTKWPEVNAIRRRSETHPNDQTVLITIRQKWISKIEFASRISFFFKHKGRGTVQMARSTQ